MLPLWEQFRPLIDRDLPQELEVGEHLACSQNDRGKRVIGYGDREACFFADALVEILDERTAAGEDDAAIGDVGGEFRRSAFECDANSVDDRRDALGEGLAESQSRRW